MNIFAIEYAENGITPCPYRSATSQCDQHVVNQIRESAQMLSAAFKVDYRPIGLSHPKHGCTLWTIESSQNYEWHLEHALELCNEYTARYDKVHKNEADIRKMFLMFRLGKGMYRPLKPTGLTPHYLAIKDYKEQEGFIVEGDVVATYRKYYVLDKDFARYYHSDRPSWFPA